MYVLLCLIVFGCQYQCNWLTGKTRLRYDLLCVEWDVKPYTLTHSLIYRSKVFNSLTTEANFFYASDIHYFGDTVALLLERRTCDLQVVGSSPGWVVHSISCWNCKNRASVDKSMKFSAEIRKVVQIKMGYGGKLSVLSVLWKSWLVLTIHKKIETYIFNQARVRIIKFILGRYVSAVYSLSSDRNG